MCGIAGALSTDADGEALVARMMMTLGHRGPDGQGCWCSTDNRLVLGHRRLAIIDLSSAAAQPLEDATGRYVISYNGEIYNYLEVRSELKLCGATFRTESDTEVILESYKQWGMKCLERLNGMFAFALYDSQERILFCARDRYGEKPFLFSAQKNLFAFASEYKALLALPQISTELDEIGLIGAAYNPSTRLDAGRQTVFRDIQQLLPAEALLLDARTMEHRIWKYWDVELDPYLATLSGRDVADRFRDLLTDSVRLRMRADVAVGSCLSGGLDSSSIVCVARGLLGRGAEYHTFTGRFPGTQADEWGYAQEVIEKTGVIPHVVEPRPERFADELGDFLWFNELPVASSSQYAQYSVFRLARENDVTVLLDGQGADELLGGYEQYFQAYVQALRESGEKSRLARELPEIRSRYPLALAPPARSLRDRLPFAVRSRLAKALGRGTGLLYGLRPEIVGEVRKTGRLARDIRYNALTSALSQESFGRFLTTLLRYGDRNSMAHSREVRLPFCDHRLANLVFSLPPQMLMGEAQTKKLLREAMMGILPESIRTRWNKQGFLPPQSSWFKGRLLELVESAFYDQDFLQSSYWDARWWQRALRRLKAGEAELAWSIWNPFIVQMWKRHFLQRAKDVRGQATPLQGNL